MIKIIFILLPLFAFASTIKVEHATLKPLGKMLNTNAKITQLSEQKQEIVSLLSGHLEAYYVKPGQKVKKGDKILLIASMELSKMSAEYRSLKQQLKATITQKDSASKLHKKGLTSQHALNNAIIAFEEIQAKKNALASQLRSLGVNPKKLDKATDQFILYAHADGVVSRILAPLHSNVNEQTPLVTLVNQEAYYALAYLSVKDAMLISKQTKGWIDIAGKIYPTHFVQLLPTIDEETQRAQVLFSIENSPNNLLLGTFTQMTISFAPTQEVLMVKKTALTLYKGEWVVFTQKEHDEHEEETHDTHEDHDHDAHKEEGHEKEGHEKKEHEAHTEEAHEETEHDTHDEHEEEEAPYVAQVVEIIAYAGEEVAIKGLDIHEEYVSEGVYFVKSMLLKSSLGEHGH